MGPGTIQKILAVTARIRSEASTMMLNNAARLGSKILNTVARLGSKILAATLRTVSKSFPEKKLPRKVIAFFFEFGSRIGSRIGSGRGSRTGSRRRHAPCLDSSDRLAYLNRRNS